MFVWTPAASCHNHRSSYARPRSLHQSLSAHGFADANPYDADAAVERAVYEHAVAHARADAVRQRREQEEALYRQRLQEQIRRQHEEALRVQRQQEWAAQQQWERRARLRRARSENLQALGSMFSGYPSSPAATLEFEVGFVDQAQARAQALRRETQFARQRQREQEDQIARAQEVAQLRKQEAQRVIASLLGFVPPAAQHHAPTRQPVRINVDRVPVATRVTVPITTSTPEKKDKGKARETPAIPIPSSKPKAFPIAPAKPSEDDVKGLLEHRLFTESEDAEVKEAISKLLGDLFGSNIDSHGEGEDEASGSKKTVHFEDRNERGRQREQGLRRKRSKDSLRSTSDTTSLLSHDDSKSIQSTSDESTSNSILSEDDRRLSLGTIQSIEHILRELRAAFVFPESLDLTPSPLPSPSRSVAPSPTPDTSKEEQPAISPEELAFTARNKPVHAYEHALNGLLSQLDAVASGGDAEIRGRRKEVIDQIESALQEIEQRVRDASRERRKLSETEEALANVENIESQTEVPSETAAALPVATESSQPSSGPSAHEESTAELEVSVAAPAVEATSTLEATAEPEIAQAQAEALLPIEHSEPNDHVLHDALGPPSAVMSEQPSPARESSVADTVTSLPSPSPVLADLESTPLGSVSEPVADTLGSDGGAVDLAPSSLLTEAPATNSDESAGNAVSSESVELMDLAADSASLPLRPSSPVPLAEAESGAVEKLSTAVDLSLPVELQAKQEEYVEAAAVVEPEAATTEASAAAVGAALPAISSEVTEPVVVEGEPATVEKNAPADVKILALAAQSLNIDCVAPSPAPSNDVMINVDGAQSVSSSASVIDPVSANPHVKDDTESVAHTDSDAFLLRSPSVSTSDPQSSSSEEEDLEIIRTEDAQVPKHVSSDTDDWSDLDSD